jgi:mono/diheme cytochrome c family protein
MQPLRLAFVVGLLVALTQQARAQDSGDVQKGRAMAQQVCAECHAVGERDAPSPNSRSPTFADIASTPGMTIAALNAAPR